MNKKDKLRPVVAYLKDGSGIYGFFHKFTQGNMANDAVIIEDGQGKIHILDMQKDLVEPKIKFIDRK